MEAEANTNPASYSSSILNSFGAQTRLPRVPPCCLHLLPEARREQTSHAGKKKDVFTAARDAFILNINSRARQRSARRTRAGRR